MIKEKEQHEQRPEAFCEKASDALRLEFYCSERV